MKELYVRFNENEAMYPLKLNSYAQESTHTRQSKCSMELIHTDHTESSVKKVFKTSEITRGRLVFQSVYRPRH